MERVHRSKEEYDRVVELHKSGLGCRKISKVTNIPVSTVYNWIYKGDKPLEISERFNTWQKDKVKLAEAMKKAARSRLKSEKFWAGRKTTGEKISKKLSQSAEDPSKELAYILGAIYGDGNMNKYEIRLKVRDFDFARTFADSISSWSGHSPNIKLNKYGLYIVKFFSVKACKILSEITFEDIKRWEKEEKIAFLRGLYDSEGSVSKRNGVIKLYNSDKELIDIISFLLDELKIKHSITFRKPSKGEINGKRFTRKINYCIFITDYENKKKFYTIIGFSIKRKQDRLKYLDTPPKNLPIDEEIKNNIINLRSYGLKYREIANKLNIGYGTVQRYAKR